MSECPDWLNWLRDREHADRTDDEPLHWGNAAQALAHISGLEGDLKSALAREQAEAEQYMQARVRELHLSERLAAALARAEAAESALGAQQRLNLSFVEQNNTLIRRNLALGDTENGPLARAEAAELENRAWRALALRSASTSGKLLFDAEISPNLEGYFVAYMDRGTKRYLDMGDGKTVEAAAIDLATKLNLLTTEPGAKGEG